MTTQQKGAQKSFTFPQIIYNLPKNNFLKINKKKLQLRHKTNDHEFNECYISNLKGLV